MSSVISQKKLWIIAVFLSELLGTAFILFAGCMGGIDNYPNFTASSFTSGLAFGVSAMISINCFEAVSGGFLNPLVALSAFINGLIDLWTTLVYIVAQIVGAYLGYLILRVAIPNEFLSNPQEFCLLQSKLPMPSAFVIEFIITFFFITFFCAIVDRRNAKMTENIPIKFGFFIFIAVSIVGPLTGAGLNPARTLAPAFYNQNWTNHWLYWFAPVSATIVSTVLYKLVFAKDYLKKSSSEDFSVEEVNIMKH